MQRQWAQNESIDGPFHPLATSSISILLKSLPHLPPYLPPHLPRDYVLQTGGGYNSGSSALGSRGASTSTAAEHELQQAQGTSISGGGGRRMLLQ
jgi:hypothetical protein